MIDRRFIIQNIKIRLLQDKKDGYDESAVERAEKILRRSPFFSKCKIANTSVYKRSVDARDKNEIFLVYSVAVSFENDSRANTLSLEDIQEICKRERIVLANNDDVVIPPYRGLSRPLVCGFGPCGMFAALILARSGARPIVVERGADADQRVKAVEEYWRTGNLSEETNVQFGEGGAGTFSDGKLLTRINDPYCSFVLETFAKHGASQDIIVNAKPHVGTDRLREIVKSIRREIISLGGEVRFNSKLTRLSSSADGKIVKAEINNGEDCICTNALFLAVGHSARDTFKMLSDSGLTLTAKPFSVGVRIEHLQSSIDYALYGKFSNHPALSHGEYALSARNGDRSIYTFCMCPGGTVVASASERDGIVTNGMSYSARDGQNANCAVAVSVNTDDYGNNPFAAIEFQASIERKAFAIAGSDGAAPIQTVGGLFGRTDGNPTKVQPTYTGKKTVCNISEVFPSFVSENLKAGLCSFDKKIHGFCSDDAVITAPETRTSSPVKLPRDDNRIALGTSCIFTCGEGAGYAGGITSAAVDGIRSALALLNMPI